MAKLNSFFNKHGGRGKNIPLDHKLEHRNKRVKTVDRVGSKLDREQCSKIGPCFGVSGSADDVC